MKLDHVPNLSEVTKKNLLAVVKQDKSIGEHNVPRYFLLKDGTKVKLLFYMTACSV